jgi:mono/diheme cytochrome c family protein
VLKKLILGLLGLIALVAIIGGGWVFMQVSAFDASLQKKYDVPLGTITLSTDPAVLERGKHIAESFGGCIACHGANLGGGKKEDMGPLGEITYGNITTGKGGHGAEYSDAELLRLLRHGLKKDGSTVRFMPVPDFNWWPDDDMVAVLSWVRQQPPVDGQPAVMKPSAMLKVLDRLDNIPVDIARRIDHSKPVEKAVIPTTPTKEYGEFLANACRGCHGAKLSGGPIPGAPPSMPVPLNLTRHETGLGAYTLDDFKTVLRTGKRKNGKMLDPFMPIEMTRNYSDLETEALFAYLQSVPPTAFGNR